MGVPGWPRVPWGRTARRQVPARGSGFSGRSGQCRQQCEGPSLPPASPWSLSCWRLRSQPLSSPWGRRAVQCWLSRGGGLVLSALASESGLPACLGPRTRSCGLMGPLVWDLEVWHRLGGGGWGPSESAARVGPPPSLPVSAWESPLTLTAPDEGHSNSLLALGDPCCGAVGQHTGGGVGGGEVCSGSGRLVQHEWTSRWGSGDRASRVSRPSQRAIAVREEGTGLNVSARLSV